MAKNKKAKYSSLSTGKDNNVSSTKPKENNSDGKLYKFESSVKVPNINEILEAASDFDAFGVSDVVIEKKHDVIVSDDGHLKAIPQGIDTIQELGNQVAEEAEREHEESRRKMKAILKKAVSTPQSVEALREVASNTVTGDRKKIVEQEMHERQQIEDAKNAVIEAREERRRMQKRAVVDLLIIKDNKEDEEILDSMAEDTVASGKVNDTDNNNYANDDFFASLYSDESSTVEDNDMLDNSNNEEEVRQEILPDNDGLDSFNDFL